MKTLKYEQVYLSEYENLADARTQIGHFLEAVYNQKRLHSSLGYLPPAEFELPSSRRVITKAETRARPSHLNFLSHPKGSLQIASTPIQNLADYRE